jgi:hypothetical protein
MIVDAIIKRYDTKVRQQAATAGLSFGGGLGAATARSELTGG